MGWIRNIIKDEKMKHANMPFGEEKYNLDWAEFAENEIIESLMVHCYSNNAIKFKNTSAQLCILDGVG